MTKKNDNQTTTHTTNPQDIIMSNWTQLVDEQIARMDTAFEEATRRQEAVMSQVNGAMDELTRLVRDSLAMQSQLGTEWLKIARGTAQRASEMVSSVTQRQ